MAEFLHEPMRCPACSGWMETGAMSVSQGLTWIRIHHDKPAEMAQAIPGTHAIARPNHLIAWRCKKCQLITARYGSTLQMHPAMNTPA